MHDVAIVGTGPAGLSAALTLTLHNKEIIWFGSRELSQKVEKAETVANYPGLFMSSGKAINEAFQKQIEASGLTITDRRVTMVAPAGDGFMVLADNDVYEAKTVLLATGVVGGRALPGEEALVGRGVSYCATCDGFLYKGKALAVLCDDSRFEAEVRYLAELAERLYFFPLYPKAAEEMPGVTRLASPISEIRGEDRVKGIALRNGEALDVDGVFILRSAVPPKTLLNGLVLEGPHIAVDRSMQTSVPGVYAAGDCTGRPYQLTKAVGEGNVAAHAILERLAGK